MNKSMEKQRTSMQMRDWKQNRKRTFIIFCMTAALTGAEYSIIVPTLLAYLRDVLHVENSNSWYGACFSIYFLSSMIGNLTITKYADRSRNIKFIISATCFMVAAGNFIYSLPFTVILVVVGRIIQGFGDTLLSVIVGETIRVYPKNEAMGKISTIISIYYIASILGPVPIAIFPNVSFNVGPVQFTIANLPNFLIGFFWLMNAILVLTVVKDLSKLYDLKKIEEESEITEEPLTLNSLLKSSVYRYILVLTCLCSFGFMFVSGSMPIVGTIVHKLHPRIISLIYTTAGVVFTITVFTMSKIDHRGDKLVYFIVFGVCFLVSGLQLITFSSLLHQHRTLGTALLFGFALCFGIAWSLDQVLLSTMLAQLIPTSTQSYAEGIRRAVACFSMTISSSVNANLGIHFQYYEFVLALLLMITGWYILVERKTYRNIQFLTKQN